MKKLVSQEDRKKFEQAQRVYEAKDYEGAQEILSELVAANPDHALLRAVLANTYWDLGRIDEALCEFEKAVLLDPASEKVSLGRFHCLWEQGDKIKALDEAKRFLLISESEEYQNILSSINED